MTLDALTKMIKSRVSLQNSNPFFSYLTMHLELVECDSKITDTCAVDNRGNLYYNPKWVDSLDQNQTTGVLTHEVLHCIFCHLERGMNKEHELYNIAADICINDIILMNGFHMPKDGLNPDISTHTIKLGGKIEIKDTDKKTAEEIYNELYKQAKKIKVTCICGGCETDSKGNKKTPGICKGFDKHIYGKKKGKCSGKGEEKEKDWKKILAEAAAFGRNRGNIPSGMERLLDTMLYPKIDWKQLLYKYITREIPADYTFMTPSKKSIASGYYMPSVTREGVEVQIIIDTSGSIGQEELTEFVSECIGMAKAFNSINMRIVQSDCEVHDDLEVRNGNIDTLMDMKIKGGGGTSFTEPLRYVKDTYPKTKVVVFFTDGYGDKVKGSDYPFNIIWVLSKNNTDECIKDAGEIIKME